MAEIVDNDRHRAEAVICLLVEGRRLGFEWQHVTVNLDGCELSGWVRRGPEGFEGHTLTVRDMRS